MSFLKGLWNDLKQQQNKNNQPTTSPESSASQTMHELGTSDRKTTVTGFQESAPQPSPAGLAPKQSGLFNKMKIKTKQQKKLQYEPPAPSAPVIVKAPQEKATVVQNSEVVQQSLYSAAEVISEHRPPVVPQRAPPSKIRKISSQAQDPVNNNNTVSYDSKYVRKEETAESVSSDTQEQQYSSIDDNRSAPDAYDVQSEIQQTPPMKKPVPVRVPVSPVETSSRQPEPAPTPASVPKVVPKSPVAAPMPQFVAPPKAAVLTKSSSVRTNSEASSSRKIQSPTKKQQEQSTKEEIMQIQKEILNSKKQLLEEISRQKQTKEQIISSNEQLISFKEQQAESIRLQNEAIEKEDYETADALETRLSELNNSIEIMEVSIQDYQRDYEKSQKAVMKFYIKQNQSRTSYIQRLHKLKAEADNQIVQLQKTENEKLDIQKVKIERVKKTMSILDNEIVFNREKLAQFESQYEEDLASQTKILKEQYSSWEAQQVRLTQEIQEIERTLRQKKQELISIGQKMAKAEESIQSVKKGFEADYSNIITRRQKLYELESQRNVHHEGLMQLESLTQSHIQEFNQQLEVARQNTSYLEQQAQDLIRESETFEDRLAQRNSTFQQFLQCTERLKAFEEKNKHKKQMIKDIEFQKSNLAVELTNLQSKRKELKEKIPVLESEKAAMIATRNFKGAKNKADELKEAQETLADIGTKIEKCYGQEKALEEQLTAVMGEDGSTQSEEDQLKRELAISQYRFQVVKLNELKKQRDMISKCGSTDRNKMLLFLDEEIANLKDELSFLKSEYGIEDLKPPTPRGMPSTTDVTNAQLVSKREQEIEQPVYESEPQGAEEEAEKQALAEEQNHISADPTEKDNNGQQEQEREQEEQEAVPEYSPFNEQEDTPPAYIPFDG